MIETITIQFEGKGYPACHPRRQLRVGDVAWIDIPPPMIKRFPGISSEPHHGWIRVRVTKCEDRRNPMIFDGTTGTLTVERWTDTRTEADRFPLTWLGEVRPRRTPTPAVVLLARLIVALARKP